MFKLKILEWIRNTEERLKKLKKKIDQQNPQPKKLKQQVINLDDMLSVGLVDDGILKAEILHNKKEVIIRIRGFANELEHLIGQNYKVLFGRQTKMQKKL